MCEYTFLLPCLNEEKCLPFCIGEIKETIKKLSLNAEILLADNGSTDSSAEIAEKLGARVISVRERGYGNAIIGGINAAQGKYIILGDADGSYDFSNLSPFITELQKGMSLVVGNRFRGGIEKRAMPFLHKLGIPFLSALANLKCHSPVKDFHCGLRAFERDAALSIGLYCGGMEFSTEIIMKFAKSKLPVCEVPTVLRKDRREGKSHIRTVRDGIRHLKFILTYKNEIAGERE